MSRGSLQQQYSKWDNIELSDDESDCHPNIDKASWFRMKHRNRVEREEQEEKEKEALQKLNAEAVKRAGELKTRLQALKHANEAGKDIEGEDEVALNAELDDIEAEMKKRNDRLEYFETHKKWNWENMCHVVEERTIVNDENAAGRKDDTVHRQLPPALQKALEEKRGTSAGREKPVPVPGPTTPQQEVLSYSSFVEKYEDIMEHYSEMKDKDEISDFLRGEGSVLFAEHAQNYLLLSCLEDEMNGKHTRMLNVARQSQYLSNITELAVSLRSPPQSVVAPFFARLKEQEHSENFEDAVRGFAGRIKNRAIEKRKEMAAEEEANYQELSKEERLGPGGLDPLEVFESLPASMQEAFQNRDTQALQDALSKMPIAEAKLHMQRCQDSGLWNSNRDGEEEEEDTHGHSHTHEHGHGHDGQCC